MPMMQFASSHARYGQAHTGAARGFPALPPGQNSGKMIVREASKLDGPEGDDAAGATKGF